MEHELKGPRCNLDMTVQNPTIALPALRSVDKRNGVLLITVLVTGARVGVRNDPEPLGLPSAHEAGCGPRRMILRGLHAALVEQIAELHDTRHRQAVAVLSGEHASVQLVE